MLQTSCQVSEKLNEAVSRNVRHGRTDGWDQIDRTPANSARGQKIVLDTAKPYVGNGYV